MLGLGSMFCRHLRDVTKEKPGDSDPNAGHERRAQGSLSRLDVSHNVFDELSHEAPHALCKRKKSPALGAAEIRSEHRAHEIMTEWLNLMELGLFPLQSCLQSGQDNEIGRRWRSTCH